MQSVRKTEGWRHEDKKLSVRSEQTAALWFVKSKGQEVIRINVEVILPAADWQKSRNDERWGAK